MAIPDPTSGATGTNVFGVNLGGDYDTSSMGGPYYLTTGAIDLTNRNSCQLRFKRWLNTDGMVMPTRRSMCLTTEPLGRGFTKTLPTRYRLTVRGRR